MDDKLSVTRLMVLVTAGMVVGVSAPIVLAVALEEAVFVTVGTDSRPMHT